MASSGLRLGWPEELYGSDGLAGAMIRGGFALYSITREAGSMLKYDD